MQEKYDVIVIGAGLAGLSAAYNLAKKGKKVLVLEKENYLGGRTSSWHENGIEIESGFHRHIGYYKKLPKLLKEVGLKLDDIIMWEKECEIIKSKDEKIVVGIDPFCHPITFLKDSFGNKEVLNKDDKLSLCKLFILGFKDYFFNTKALDNYSIFEYAQKHNISKKIIDTVIVSLSTGIFFLPISSYSAKLFFGLFYPAIFNPWKVRIGAYKGGMSKVLAQPIAQKITKYKGVIKNNCNVASLIYCKNKVVGVKTEGKDYYASFTILATDINNAKKIVDSLPHNFKEKILKVPLLSVITVHFELAEPAMTIDQATFTTNTIIASFTEESRSSFPNSKGRISVILKSTKKINFLDDENIILETIKAFKSIGKDFEKNILKSVVVRHIDKFYDFSSHNDKYRLNQKTPINGLVLAGDYTKQKFYSTMEGAVISGIKASNLVK